MALARREPRAAAALGAPAVARVVRHHLGRDGGAEIGIAGVADDIESGFSLEEAAQALAHDDMVIDQQASDGGLLLWFHWAVSSVPGGWG